MGTFTGNENVSSYYVKAKLSPDGSLLASGSPTDDVCVWDVAWSGNPIARLKVCCLSHVVLRPTSLATSGFS